MAAWTEHNEITVREFNDRGGKGAFWCCIGHRNGRCSSFHDELARSRM